jgi:Fe2+ or Zn2+ uptake regulation protein
MSSIDEFCERLKAQGRRLTPQRRAIIQAILESDSHATAERIFARVRDAMPDMSPATVYNTLHELAEVGALLELDLGLNERRYDVVTADHAHLVCLGCKRVEDVPLDCAALALSPQEARGFQIVNCNVIYRGYCPDCTPSTNEGKPT